MTVSIIVRIAIINFHQTFNDERLTASGRAVLSTIRDFQILLSVALARQLNLEVESDGVRELLDSHHRELTTEELVEKNIDYESLDAVQSEDRMMVGNWTEGVDLGVEQELHAHTNCRKYGQRRAYLCN
ncbi:hypothetical protein TNCV_4782181 [Trichonephila clavipes]|nr:hypothetical protein TNCV_4782181 [Trichonephila clavipes]